MTLGLLITTIQKFAIQIWIDLPSNNLKSKEKYEKKDRIPYLSR